jgi:ubiquitin-protein ligase
MPDLIQRIINLIHQDVNPFSPANSSLYQIYKEEPKKYEEIMR